MGETTAYIILHDNAENDKALYVNFADNPPCSFGGSGVVLGEDGLCAIPHFPYEAICPYCRSETYDSLENMLSESCEIAENFSIKCEKCNKSYGTKEVNSSNVNWYIAKNYIYISDIDQDEWDEDRIAVKIRGTLSGVIGIYLGSDA